VEHKLKETKNKFLAWTLMIATFGLFVPDVLKKEHDFEPGSLKDKNMRLNNILWAIIYFFFFVMIAAACFDSFFINRAVLFKYLTRVALSMLVYILITDGIVTIIKDSGKAKNHKR
jgi:cell division protein FtsW (lipid II flippase)